MLEQRILKFFLKDDNKIPWNKDELKQALKDYKYMLHNKIDRLNLIQDIGVIIMNTYDKELKQEGTDIINEILKMEA